MLLISKLNEIFYKDYDEYIEILFSGNNKYFLMKFYNYFFHYLTIHDVKYIQKNIENVFVKKEEKDKKNYKLIFILNNKHIRTFTIQEDSRDCFKEISHSEYIKNLI